jgi:hypothetical protein
MSPEERADLMEFILQSQSSAAVRHQEAMKQMDEFGIELREHTAQLRQHTAEIQVLASVSRDLLEVSRIHSRRLDQLES